jgi:flagellar hook-associated protein 2
MSNITITGLGSGIDTDAIVTALVALERRPIDLLESKKALAKKKVDLLGTLKGYVNALKTAATALGKPDSLLSTKVTSRIDGIATFSASGRPPWSHTLDRIATMRRDFASATEPRT